MKSKTWSNSLVSVLFLMLSAGVAPATTRYAVPTGGAGSGPCDSWAKACTLTVALGVAVSGDQVRVRYGTYTPGLSRTATFLLKDGVGVFGAYFPIGGGKFIPPGSGRSVPTCIDGDSTDAVDYTGRPCAEDADCGPSGTCTSSAFATILSGDINGDDVSCTSDGDCSGSCQGGICSESRDDNSYHVVTFEDYNATTVPRLDGLIIEAGSADGTGSSPINNQGPGIQLRDSDVCAGVSAASIDVRDCLIRNHYASDHGAVNDHYAASSFDNCVFRDNLAGKGGGLLVDNGSPTLTNCLFEKNIATTVGGGAGEGGGAWVRERDDPDCPNDPDPSFDNCVFVGNEASIGGGVWGGSGTAPTFTGCTFSDNLAIKTGGGIFAIDTRVTNITNCQFLDNKTTFNGAQTPVTGGAGVWIQGGNNASVYGSVFARNSSSGTFQTGGGLYVLSVAAIVEDCEFRENFASFFGGSLYNNGDGTSYTGCLFVDNTSWAGGNVAYDNADATYTNCRFLGNSGASSGGVSFDIGDVTWTNCLFSGNSAASGGAVFINGGKASLVNCTLSENHASNSTGGIFQNFGPAAIVQNCILWGNTDEDSSTNTLDEQIFGSPSAPIVTYSCIQDDDPSSIPFGGAANGNIDDDPLFLAPGGYGDFRLEDGSPCIDEGDNDVASGTDLDGAKRILDGVVDMGAYECNTRCDDDDVCTFDQCDPLLEDCNNTSNTYGDVNHDGTVDDADVDCALDGFAGVFIDCGFQDVDIFPCTPNGIVDLDDLLAVLDAYNGIDPCCGN